MGVGVIYIVWGQVKQLVYQMYLSVIFIPFVSFITLILGGRFLGSKGSVLLAIISMILTSFLGLTIFVEVVLFKSLCTFKLYPWFNTEAFLAGWGFYYDTLTAGMILVITSVSLLVHIYACEYMSADPHRSRFLSFLSLFTFFMLLLVTADNYLQMFIGWEGVGLASYLLIGFWSTRIQANKSAIKAMIMNRIGDIGLCLAFFALIAGYQTLDYVLLFSDPGTRSVVYFLGFTFPLSTYICFFILWGAIGKSAQLGLHTWLPDAMEGPTPVSALIHAATMVTAGVFVIIRSAPLFEFSPMVLKITCVVGSATAFFAASIGLVQNDLKKVIAFSTCSQLGYMIFSCGLSNYSVAFFHLANHAFFKALLFLGAGCIIHGIVDEQDMRRMGLGKVFYFSYTMILIGSLALIGFPFLTGYYSKDLILELAFARYDWLGSLAHFFGISAALCTSLYSFRLLFLTFLNNNLCFRTTIIQAHEPGLLMSFPVLLLCFGAIFFGYICFDLIVGFGNDTWNGVIVSKFPNSFLSEAEFLTTWDKHIPFFIGITGGLCSLAFSSTILSINLRKNIFQAIFKSTILRNTVRYLSDKWHIDQVYNIFIADVLLALGYNNTFFLLDKGFLELIGPRGISYLTNTHSFRLSKIHQGFIYYYALFFVLAVVVILLLLEWQKFALSINIDLATCLSFVIAYIVSSHN